MKETFRRVKELFLESLQKEDPADRAAFLREACGSDVVLHRQVEALLRKHDHAGSFLEQPAAASEPEGVLAAAAGSRIGPYRLLELIGEGGMGSVWLAQQQEPVKRQVALKIIKPGMDSAEVIARFEAERQALALMDHPHIARVLDAGALESGRPYFVMDLVQGVPITRWCAEQALTTRQRLELFVGVCQAVQHAHQKGIIHRDLKPSNVLVASCDGQAAPRVIDFGVAKALGEPLTERTLFTGLGSIVGTFEYMSPEQAEFNALDVDTRADVYSLGVLLYELLTGTTPLTKQRLQQTPLSEVLRLIREEEPPRPSSRLPKGLGAFQELDWIVLKCLEKDRARRYQSASDLARDVERHLRDEPVEAGPPGAGYRLRKFVKRQRKALAVAAGFVLLLLTGTGVSIWQAVRATQAEALARQSETLALVQKERAEGAEVLATTQRNQAMAEKGRADAEAAITRAVNGFLLEDLLGQSDVANQPGRPERDPDVTVRELLDRAAAGIDGKFSGQELTEAALRNTVGSAYLALGKYAEAEKHLARSLVLRRQKRGANHPDTLLSLSRLASLSQARGRLDEAERLCKEVLKGYRAHHGADHPHTWTALHNLGTVYHLRGRHGKAERLFWQALEGKRARLGANHLETLASMSNLAAVYQERGRYDEAERLFQQVLHGRRTQLGGDHPHTLNSLNDLGVLALHRGRFTEAEPLLRQALAGRRTKLGADHPHTLDTLGNLALVCQARGRLDEAERLCKQVLEGRRTRLGADHPKTLIALNDLATLYYHRGRYAEAEPLFRQALEGRRKRLGADHPLTLASTNNLALIQMQRGRLDEAEQLFKQVVETRRARLGPGLPESLIGLHNLGLLSLRRGRHAEAESLLKQAVNGWCARRSPDFPDTLASMQLLAAVYQARGRLDDAQRLLEHVLASRRARRETAHPSTLLSMNRLGWLYQARGRYDQAQPLLGEAAAGVRKALGPGHPYTQGFTHDLLVLYGKQGEALLGQKKYDEAERLLVRGYQELKERPGSIPAALRQARLSEALARLVRLCEALGRKDEAAKWRQELERTKAAAKKP